jgi:hypothetical protein
MTTQASVQSCTSGHFPAPVANECASSTHCYCRPQLALVGTLNRLVQSGPSGNRYETYRCSYWSC